MDLYVFAAIGLIGFLFIVISFLMGEIGHVGDFGHDGEIGNVGEMGHVGDMDGADHEVHVGDAHGFHEHAGDAGDGPGPLSTRIISIFLTTFGAVATAARLSGLAPATSAALGFAGGYGLGWCTWRFMRLLWSQGASSHIHTGDLAGTTGEVTVAIPASGPGQVACVLSGTRTHQIARSATGQEIALGSTVRIASITPEGVLVEPVPDEPNRSSEALKGRL